MDNKKDDKYYIEKIKENMSFICKHMNEVSMEDLEKNEILLDSMMFRLIQISEESKKLSDKFKEDLDEIPWHAISGLRNRLVHDYGNVDLTIVYDTLTYDIPKLLALIKDGKS